MKKIASLFSTLCIMCCILLVLPLNASAASSDIQDGLEVSIITNKDEYSADEDVQVSVNVKNTNSNSVGEISIQTLLPEGLVVKSGDLKITNITIDPGKTYSNNVIAQLSDDLKKDNGTEPDDTTKPGGTTADKDSNGSNDSTRPENTTQPGNNKDITVPKTGDTSQIVLWIVLFVISAICITLLIIFRSKAKKSIKVLSLFLCVAMILTMIPMGVFAAQTNDGNISVDKTIIIDGNSFLVCAQISIHKNGNDDVADRSVYTPDEKNIVTNEELEISYVNNMIIIVFDESASSSDIDKVIESINGIVVGKIKLINQYQVQIKECSLDELKRIVYNVEQNDCVLFAHYDQAYKNLESSVAPNDPWAGDVDAVDWADADVDGSNWWLEAIEAPSAWDYNDRFSKIKVGIVDNGFDTGHEDLSVTFPDDFGRLNSKEDHGTHVAGIIGAKPNNNKGITGLVWNSELICFDYEATLSQDIFFDWETDTMIYAGLIFNVEAGAKVINFSLGYAGTYPNGKEYTQSVIDDHGRTASGYMAVLLKTYDFVVVKSAGNGGVDAKNSLFFASITSSNCVDWGNGRATKQNILNRLLIVAAVQRSENGYIISEFSDSGSQVNICAPGGDGSERNDRDIYSTVTGGFHGKYKALSGTSMAAPIVTGVASLVWSVNNTFSGSEVVDIVRNSTNVMVLDNPASTKTSGDHPMVNAKLAVEEAIRRTATGTLSGKICKASDRTMAIPGASVEVYRNNLLYTTSTSNSSGNYTINLHEGRYLVKISAPGYIDFKSYATVSNNENTYMETFLLIEGSEHENGVASGKVVNSLTGNGVSEVNLVVKRDWNNTSEADAVVKTAVTDANGNYSIELPLGNYTVAISKDGYTSSAFNIIVQSGTTENQNGTITPIILGDNYLITLTWGENPRDLDSHVEGTLNNGDSFHVYYSHQSQYDGEFEVCTLDYDDTDGYGPEHITLNTTCDTPYYYYIFKYAGEGTVALSGAKVTIEQGNTLIAEFNVPTDLGESNYWNVFAIKNGELIVKNTISESPDTTYAK